ncbi:MAG: glycosyltransferase family 39 protein, partial [Nitrospinota bacterium]|nr:glycosyltransferase family 39 protein [Nitrospinota bacterium]
ANGAGEAEVFGADFSDGVYPLGPTAIAIVYSLAGEADEFLARIPSTLFAFGVLYMVYRTGAMLFGPMAGLFAFGVLSTSALFSFSARSSGPDMAVCLFLSISLLSLARMTKDQDQSSETSLINEASIPKLPKPYWISLGLAFYAGGPAPVLISLAGAWAAARGGAFGKDGIGRVFNLRGAAMLSAMIAPWIIFSIVSDGVGLGAPSAGVAQSAWAAHGLGEFVAQGLLFIPWIFIAPAALRFCGEVDNVPGRVLLAYMVGGAIAAAVLAAFGQVHTLALHAALAVMAGGYIQRCQPGMAKLDATKPDTGENLWEAPFISHLIIIFPLMVFVFFTFMAWLYSPIVSGGIYADFDGGFSDTLISFAALLPVPSVMAALAFLSAIYVSYKAMEMFAKSGETWWMWTATVVASFSFLVYINHVLAPKMNRSFSHKVYFSQISHFMEPGGRLFHFGKDNVQARFYLDGAQAPGHLEKEAIPALLGELVRNRETAYFLTDRSRKASLEKSFKDSHIKSMVYIDSYFVPPTRGMETGRLYLFAFPPSFAEEQGSNVSDIHNKR